MQIDFNIRLAENFTIKKIQRALPLIGELIRSRAVKNTDQFIEQTGNLKNSIKYKVFLSDLKVEVSANTVYALIQEIGGEIKPVDAKALAIPIHPDAKSTVLPEGSSIRDAFPDLFIIQTKKGNALLVRKAGRGFNHSRLDIMYVLVKKTYIPAKPYLRPALYESENDILMVFENVN